MIVPSAHNEADDNDQEHSEDGEEHGCFGHAFDAMLGDHEYR